MNLESLESFRVFAETLNFTHAAKRRHLTQPALHKQIQNLSEEAGTELYRKSGRTLQLTDAGIKMARFCREFSDRKDRLYDEIRPGGTNTTVKLAAGRGSFLYLLGDAIRAFSKLQTSEAKFLTLNQSGTLEAVRSGEAHIGVTVLDEIPEDLKAELLCVVDPQLVVSNKHLLARRKLIRLSDLDDLPLICPRPPSKLRDTISALLNSRKMSFRPVLNTDGWELLMHFASLGLGATVVNGCCQPPRGARAIPLQGLPSTRYYLVTHKDEFTFPDLERMKACIAKHVSRVRLFS